MSERGFMICQLTQQEKPFRDNKIEAGMNASIVKELMRHEAPAEIYDRFGLNQGSTA